MFSIALLFAGNSISAQQKDSVPVKKDTVPNNWHLLDTTFNGINLDKAYEFLKQKGKVSTNVIVGVVDSGIDTLHEDLKPVLWVNSNPGASGYPGDIHGWNFIGGKDGRNLKTDSYEAARVYYKLKPKWDKEVDVNSLKPSDVKEYATYLRAKEKVVGDVDDAQTNMLKMMVPKFMTGDSVIKKEIAKEVYDARDLQNYTPSNMDAIMTKTLVMNISKMNNSDEITNIELLEEFTNELNKAKAAGVAPPNYRKEIVGDNESDINDKFYGNSDIMANTPFHGTHCAGIIGAARNNGLGMDGIADNVSLLTVRAVPDGDEHDKDIALGIRYAIDNGAKVISMSFGKDFSPEKEWVDAAFRYAQSKDVLLVHAAGNDAKNIDTTFNFPNMNYEMGGKAYNLITVGASGNKLNGGLVASFSNYGPIQVDVFAPGVGIYSTIPGGNKYGKASGTSMACPVVAGIAALIREYYPNLSAQQVKFIIESSVVKPTGLVKNPATKEMVSMSDLSKTGGIVNAYEAILLADRMETDRLRPGFN